MNHEKWSDAQSAVEVAANGHDLEVAYYEGGGDHDGPPVVFLHGIPTWSFLWREVAPPLAEERRVLALDLVGYGNSSMHDGFDRSIRAQERMVESFLDAVAPDAEAVDLVGHDIGGGVALRLASHDPERVRRLVLSNAVAYDSWPVEFVSGLGLPGTVEGWDDDELEAKLDFAFADGLYDDDAHETHDAFVEGMKAPWRSPEGRTALSRAAVATNTNHTTELDYAAITADTLLLWGANDVLQPLDYARRLAADVVGETEVVELDRAYHWVVEDRAEEYLDRLRAFLTETNRVAD